MTIILQSQRVRETLRTIGFKKSDYRVHTDTHVYQRNGHTNREYGDPIITLLNTKKAVEFLPQLEKHFIVQLILRGTSIHIVLVYQPGSHRKPGRIADILLDEKEKA